MMFAMNSRPIRPTSRKSNFPLEVPSVIYSQSAADLRPPPDYIGPNKARLQRQPEPSMNPKKFSLPILSVSKLEVNTSAPRTSTATFPVVKAGPPRKPGRFAGVSSTFLHCNQAKHALELNPTLLRPQFRPDLKKKRPIKGVVRKFIHRDIHSTSPRDHRVLHGIILLGGQHRDMIEETPREQGTPRPLSGRQHSNCQTDTYLEDIADNETGFYSVAVQCDPVHDEPLKAPDLNRIEKDHKTSGTQLHRWTFPEIDHIFDQMANNLAEAVIMESLKQLQEENELEALRKQQDYHKCLMNRELAILAKYKAAHAKRQDQKRIIDAQKPWDQTLNQIIELVGFEKIKDCAPKHYIGARTDEAIMELINETVVPPINDEVLDKLEMKYMSRRVLDGMIEETVLKKEGQYAANMYIGDPTRKGSMASRTPSRHSLDLEESPSEYDDYDYDDEMWNTGSRPYGFSQK